MATGNKLEVQIGADITDFQKKIKEVEFDVKELSKAKLEKIKLGLDTREITAQIKDAKASLNSLKTAVKDTGAQVGGQFTKQVGNGNNALMQFSRIAQDAPFGIMGIGNNITATAESFGYLKQQTGSTSGALKAMASSLMGTGGILLGVSLLTTGFTLLSQSGLSIGDVFDKITGKAESFARTLSKVNDEAYKDKGVQEAITNVNELTNEIDLAKKGFLDKDQVVNHYNETIGKTTGLVKNINEAEQELTKNADAYIKMTLYKSAANLALQDAAKQQLDAERSRVKKLSEFTNAFLDADLTQTRSKEQYNQKQKNLQNQLKLRQAEEIKVNEDASKKNLSIAKNFQDEAAKIAKGFGFNFFGDTKAAAKPKAPKKTKVNPNAGNEFTPFLQEFTGALVPEMALTFKDPTDGFTEWNSKIAAGLTTTEMMWDNFSLNLSSIIETGTEDALIGFGESIGNALAMGTNVFKEAGASLIASIGNMISSVGKELVKMGVLAQAYAAVVKWMKSAFANPYALAAAGVALIAIGAAVSSSAKKVGNGGSGGGMSSATGQGANNSSTTSGSGTGWSGGANGTVVFEIAGTSLIGVLNNTTARNLRIGGR